MKQAVNFDKNWMTRRYVLALSVIAILASIGFTAFIGMISQYEDLVSVVNISGRQRMLSQRIALLTRNLLQARSLDEGAKVRADLRESAALMLKSHKMLISKGDRIFQNSELWRIYFDKLDGVDTKVRKYVKAVNLILSISSESLNLDNPTVSYVLNEAPNILTSLDEVVSQYELAGDRALFQFRIFQSATLLMFFATLAIEAWLIFRPMVRQVEQQIDKISQISDALLEARNNLETTVQERTKELLEAKEDAERSSLAKSRFLAAASHDIKQPLEAIGMFTGILERHSENRGDKAIMGHLHAAQRSMRLLLDSLLDMSKLEAKTVVPQYEAIPLELIFEQIVAELSYAAKAKNVDLQIVNTTVVVLSDVMLLERIIRNLISNAVRYTQRGRVLVGCRRDGNFARIEIHDSGPGIEEKDTKLIFEEFTQLTDPDRDRSEGIGLGLSIVERTAKLLGHPLGLRSVVGKGSVFSVTIPLA